MWLNMFKIFITLYIIIALIIILIIRDDEDSKEDKIEKCLCGSIMSFLISLVIVFIIIVIGGIVSYFTTKEEVVSNSQHYPLVYLKDETNKGVVTNGEYHSGYFLFMGGADGKLSQSIQETSVIKFMTKDIEEDTRGAIRLKEIDAKNDKWCIMNDVENKDDSWLEIRYNTRTKHYSWFDKKVFCREDENDNKPTDIQYIFHITNSSIEVLGKYNIDMK